MKSHQAAKLLEKLAVLLKSGPNIELNQLGITGKLHVEYESRGKLEIGLSTLASLSKIKKMQWINFINDYNFPIEIKARDSSRNILGKLLKYLDSNPNAYAQIRNNALRKTDKSSQELLKALSKLIGDNP